MGKGKAGIEKGLSGRRRRRLPRTLVDEKPLVKKTDSQPDIAHIDPALLESLEEILEDPEAWLRTPNTVFGGRRPLDLLGTPEEPILRNRILAATLGMFS